MSAMALAMGMPACVLRYIDIWLIPPASSVFFSLSVCDEYPLFVHLKEISPPLFTTTPLPCQPRSFYGMNMCRISLFRIFSPYRYV